MLPGEAHERAGDDDRDEGGDERGEGQRQRPEDQHQQEDDEQRGKVLYLIALVAGCFLLVDLGGEGASHVCLQPGGERRPGRSWPAPH